MQMDKGGIRFIMNGADVMCPGLTSAGGNLADCGAGDIIALFCEGKEHAIAVGVCKLSSADMCATRAGTPVTGALLLTCHACLRASKNKGIGIETVHFLNDDFWKIKIFR
jgi:PUA domain protein